MNSAFKSCGLISLTTDFGIGSPFVGLMKAAILSRFPQATIVDLMHQVEPYDMTEAGFWLGRSYHRLPPGSVHIAVVDPGVGSQRRILLAQLPEHILIAPDNGLLDRACGRIGNIRFYSLNIARACEMLKLSVPSMTFHGRDLMAPVAAELAANRITIAELGEPLTDIVSADRPSAARENGCIKGTVVSIDHYGNLITDIDREMLAGPLADFVVECAGLRLAMHNTYADVNAGEVLALINSFNVVEIARACGNAAAFLQLERGAEIRVLSAT